MRTRILSDRVLCIGERYMKRDYNHRIHVELWEERPRDVKILRGPTCTSRVIPSSYRADGSTSAQQPSDSKPEELESDSIGQRSHTKSSIYISVEATYNGVRFTVISSMVGCTSSVISYKQLG